MTGVNTRVEGAHYFANVYLEDEERFEPYFFEVPEGKTPEEILMETYSGKRIHIESGKIYPLSLRQLIPALNDYDQKLRKDHTPRGIAQVADLEGEVRFEGIR